MKETSCCIIFESYEVMELQPYEKFIKLSREYRDSWLETSEYSHLISYYYELSKELEGNLTRECATEIIENRLPNIINYIELKKFELAAKHVEMMLDFISEFSKNSNLVVA